MTPKHTRKVKEFKDLPKHFKLVGNGKDAVACPNCGISQMTHHDRPMLADTGFFDDRHGCINPLTLHIKFSCSHCFLVFTLEIRSDGGETVVKWLDHTAPADFYALTGVWDGPGAPPDPD
jgi:hypothetical protein